MSVMRPAVRLIVPVLMAVIVHVLMAVIVPVGGPTMRFIMPVLRPTMAVIVSMVCTAVSVMVLIFLEQHFVIPLRDAYNGSEAMWLRDTVRATQQ
jgi:hypothetical protein